MEDENLVESLESEDVVEENDSAEYEKAITFEIDDSWPDELKQQVAQLNQMSSIINSEPSIEDDDDDDESDSNDEELDEEENEDDEDDEESNISEDETETFENIF